MMSHQAAEVMARDHARSLLRTAEVRRAIRRRRGEAAKRTSTASPLPGRRPAADPATTSLHLRQT